MKGQAMERIRFSLGGGYTAYIGAGASGLLGEELCSLAPAKAALVSDDGLPEGLVSACAEAIRAAGFEPLNVRIPHGESNKTLETVSGIYSAFYEAGLTRADAVIGLGGGVTLDTAGFAAATYLRGLAFVSVPTTLIAQTDSAYGGKTGVDFREGKNHVGVFAHPKAVLCDTEALRTLPERERVSGMGEIIKYGAIADPALLDRVSSDLPGADVTARCVKIKRDLVEQDEFDSGVRRTLNFGHTFGHAFEAASGFTLPHGQAVAYGMLAGVRLGERLGVTAPGVYERILEACARAGLDTGWEPLLPSARAFAARDKKSDGENIRFVFLEDIGKPTVKSIPLGVLVGEI